MAFVLLGVAFLALKLLDWGPVAHWSWWVILAPFGLALAWWTWSDYSGLTRKREMVRDQERKANRRKRNISAMGLGPDAPRSGTIRRR
jgi:small Trp-rich protein